MSRETQPGRSAPVTPRELHAVRRACTGTPVIKRRMIQLLVNTELENMLKEVIVSEVFAQTLHFPKDSV